jgi:hypothetical protein
VKAGLVPPTRRVFSLGYGEELKALILRQFCASRRQCRAVVGGFKRYIGAWARDAETR